MAPIEAPLIADLKHIRPHNEVGPFRLHRDRLMSAGIAARRRLLVAEHPRAGAVPPGHPRSRQAWRPIFRRDRPPQHAAQAHRGRSRRAKSTASLPSRRSTATIRTRIRWLKWFLMPLISGAQLDTDRRLRTGSWRRNPAAVLSLAAATVSLHTDHRSGRPHRERTSSLQRRSLLARCAGMARAHRHRSVSRARRSQSRRARYFPRYRIYRNRASL